MAKVLIVLSDTNQPCISCEYAHVHRVSLSTTNFQNIRFRVIAMKNYFSTFNWLNIKVEKESNSQKKTRNIISEFSANMHISHYDLHDK